MLRDELIRQFRLRSGDQRRGGVASRPGRRGNGASKPLRVVTKQPPVPCESSSPRTRRSCVQCRWRRSIRKWKLWMADGGTCLSRIRIKRKAAPLPGSPSILSEVVQGKRAACGAPSVHEEAQRICSRPDGEGFRDWGAMWRGQR